MSTSNFLPARDDQLFAPGAWSKTYTVSGLSVVQASNWVARIVHNKGDNQATSSLVTPTVSVDTGANSVTFSLTATQVLALISAGAPKFTGYWSVYNTSTTMEYVAGAFVIDRTATNPGTSSSPTTLTVTSTTSTLTVLSAAAATLQTRSSLFPIGDYGTLDLTGATDMSTIVQLAINAAAVAGGTVVFPAGIILCQYQLSIPFNAGPSANGAYRQAPILFKGAGGYASGQVTAVLGGTRLRLTYTQTTPGDFNDAKIVTYGLGHLACEDITFEDTTTAAQTPFIYTTNTTLHINKCAFYGAAANANTPQQDAIILGGKEKPGATGYGSHDSGFQGYGTVISNNYFNNIRRIVYGRSYCNQTQVAFNFADKGCGTNLSGGACIEYNGALKSDEVAVNDGDYDTNNQIIGNYLEAPNYVYGIKLIKCVSTSVVGNGFVDPGAGVVALVRCEGFVTGGVSRGSEDNTLIGNYSVNATVLSEDSMSQYKNNVIGGQTGQGTFLARGPLTLRDPSLALNVVGPVTLGKYPNLIQPEAATGTDGAVLLNIKRSAAESVNPSALIFQVTQDGQITFKDHNTNGFVFDPGAGTFTATTAKNIAWDCAGGGQFSTKAASFMYQDHFGGGERVLLTYSAAQTGGQIRLGGASGPIILNGTGSPESVVTAPVGSLFLRTDGGAGTTLYVKQTGAGNTGWVGK